MDPPPLQQLPVQVVALVPDQAVQAEAQVELQVQAEAQAPVQVQAEAQVQDLLIYHTQPQNQLLVMQ